MTQWQKKHHCIILDCRLLDPLLQLLLPALFHLLHPHSSRGSIDHLLTCLELLPRPHHLLLKTRQSKKWRTIMILTNTQQAQDIVSLLRVVSRNQERRESRSQKKCFHLRLSHHKETLLLQSYHHRFSQALRVLRRPDGRTLARQQIFNAPVLVSEDQQMLADNRLNKVSLLPK